VNDLLLDGLLALPAGFAVLTAVLAGRERRGPVALRVAVLGGLLTLAWSVWLVLADPGLRAVNHPWLAALDVHWRLGLDGISAPLVLLTTLITAGCLVSLLHAPDVRGAGALAALLLLVETGVLGSFVALDMVLFFVFFEVALIPLWFVIDRWGDRHDPRGRRRAATRFLVFTVLGSALMLVGFMLVREVAGTFDIVTVAARGVAGQAGSPRSGLLAAAAVLVALGLAVKTPLWPLHIWLPDAHAKAPTVGSVLLAAVLLKLGSYGLIRFWMPLVDPGWQLLAPCLAALGVVGIVYAALACLVQDDLKRLIAYSSVGHMGFVALGVATFTVGGVQAAVFVSVAHGLITGLLFFLAGGIKDRYDTTLLDRLQVLYGRLPRLAGLFAFAAMASLGLPGLAGFWGEMLAIRAAVLPDGALPRATYLVLAVIAALGVVLTAAYFLALMRRILQGAPPAVQPVNPGTDSVELVSEEVEPGTAAVEPRPVADVRRSEWLVWTPLATLTVLLGVMPGLLLTPVAAAARAYFGGL
jgi:NADH-quinone oxidoreductase subunit M